MPYSCSREGHQLFVDFSQAFGAMQLKLPVAVERIFLPYHSQLLVQVKPYQNGYTLRKFPDHPGASQAVTVPPSQTVTAEIAAPSEQAAPVTRQEPHTTPCTPQSHTIRPGFPTCLSPCFPWQESQMSHSPKQ